MLAGGAVMPSDSLADAGQRAAVRIGQSRAASALGGSFGS
jgi:hypothetical protein